MKMNEKELEKVAGGLQVVELKDGSFVIIADQAKKYSSADEAKNDISKIEENIQFGRGPGKGMGMPRHHHGPHHNFMPLSPQPFGGEGNGVAPNNNDTPHQ